RVDSDGEGLRPGGVLTAAGGTAVVLEIHGDRGRAEGVRGRREGQPARGVDGRLRREQGGVVIDRLERQRLTALVGAAPGRHVGGKAVAVEGARVLFEGDRSRR